MLSTHTNLISQSCLLLLLCAIRHTVPTLRENVSVLPFTVANEISKVFGNDNHAFLIQSFQ